MKNKVVPINGSAGWKRMAERLAAELDALAQFYETITQEQGEDLDELTEVKDLLAEYAEMLERE